MTITKTRKFVLLYRVLSRTKLVASNFFIDERTFELMRNIVVALLIELQICYISWHFIFYIPNK